MARLSNPSVGATVQTGELDDDVVTLAKMAGGTDGNIICYDASGNPAFVATGASGQVLMSNGAGAAPTMQSLPAAIEFSNQEDIIAADQTTTSTTYVTTALSIVIANRSGGSCLCLTVCNVSGSGVGDVLILVFFDDGAALTGDSISVSSGGGRQHSITLASIVSLNGSTIDVRMKTIVNTGELHFDANQGESKMVVWEVS